jgi:hypothetical protein
MRSADVEDGSHGRQRRRRLPAPGDQGSIAAFRAAPAGFIGAQKRSPVTDQVVNDPFLRDFATVPVGEVTPER